MRNTGTLLNKSFSKWEFQDKKIRKLNLDVILKKTHLCSLTAIKEYASEKISTWWK
jgi:hypothetical protein